MLFNTKKNNALRINEYNNILLFYVYSHLFCKFVNFFDFDEKINFVSFGKKSYDLKIRRFHTVHVCRIVETIFDRL